MAALYVCRSRHMQSKYSFCVKENGAGEWRRGPTADVLSKPVRDQRNLMHVKLRTNDVHR